MKKTILTLCILLIFCAPAYAGQQTGTMTTLIVRASDGLVFFNLSGAYIDKPACAGNYDYWMITDENSNTGKQQLSLLMAARLSGATVTVHGNNTCNRWSDGEDVNVIVY